MTTTTEQAKAKTNGHEPALPNVRLVGVQIQVEAVLDDGTTLTPLGLQPVALTAGQWPDFDMGAYLAEVARQVAKGAGQ